MIRRIIFVFLTICFFTVSAAMAVSPSDYQYISAQNLQERLKNKSPMILVDICVAEQYAKGHIPGAIETDAYPVETDEQRQRLAKVLPMLQASADDVVVVCPRGGGGAKKAVDFYKVRGIGENRLLILEKGMDNWPYATE